MHQGEWELKLLERADDLDDDTDDWPPHKTDERWFALIYKVKGDQTISFAFTEVRASGGLIHLEKDGERIASLNRMIDGSNRHYHNSALPDVIFGQLREIGPW